MGAWSFAWIPAIWRFKLAESLWCVHNAPFMNVKCNQRALVAFGQEADRGGEIIVSSCAILDVLLVKWLLNMVG